MEGYTILKVFEVMQCVDVFLIKFNCPFCNEQNLSGINKMECEYCKKKFDKRVFDIGDFNVRLISGSKRKRRTKFNREIKALLEIQSNHCAYCGKNFELNQYVVEHIIPLSFGGTNNIRNLVLSCSLCNSIAWSFVFDNFEEKKNYILLKLKQRSEYTIDAQIFNT